MTPWQVLCANRAAWAALGHRGHHGPGGLVHYSSAPAAGAPHGSFCLSREKLSILNRRLAFYLQQGQCLEAANRRLEHQIQEELDRKCPGQLSGLDERLRTVSLLQEQISECLSAHAQVKLQLLTAELAVFDLSSRCEKERERRSCIEAKLSDLRLLREELQVHRLPELHRLLNDQTQLLTELRTKHQQDVQGLQAQVSRGVTTRLHTAESLDLIQQLDDLRRTRVEVNLNERCFSAQVSWRGSAGMTYEPAAVSEAIRAELEELRSTAASLEEELKQLQALNVVLEASSLDQAESFTLQLVVLQQRTDVLSRELDSVLQAAAQQAADHQVLQGVRTRLETEIQNYKMLLDGLHPQGLSSLRTVSAANITSFRVTTGPSAFGRKITENKTVNGQGDTFSGCHIHTVRQTPIGAQLPGKMSRVQSVQIHNKYPKNSPVRSVNTSYLTGSFTKSENQKRALHERNGKKSMTISTITTINRQNNSVEDKVNIEDCDQLQELILSSQISQGLDGKAVLKASKPEIITAQGITTLVPDTHSARGTSAQAKPEMTTEAVLQVDETVTNIQTENTNTILHREPKIKEEPSFVTTKSDPNQQIAAGVKKVTESVTSAQMNSTEGSIQAKNQVPSSLDTLGEAVKTSPSVTDFSVAMMSSGPEDLLKSKEAHLFASPTEPPMYLSPEVCLSPVEAEVLMTMTDQLFCPVNAEEHVRGPDFPLSPNSPEMFPSPNDCDMYLSPAEDKMCLSPNGEEEDEEVCLSLIEANAHVLPVEKYILLTKESSSGDEALPEEDRQGKDSISVRDGNSSCVGSFEDNEQRILNVANISSRPASPETCPKLSSSFGGSQLGSPDICNIIADKEKQVGFGGLYRKSVTDARSPGDRCKDTGGTGDNKDLSASFGGTTANLAGAVGGNASVDTTAGVQGRLRHGSGEWMVYGGTLRHRSAGLPCTGSEKGPSETGRFGCRGNGEWMVYGGSLGRKSSLDGGSTLPSGRKEQGSSVATKPSTSPEEAGRFSHRGNGEWVVYAGSTGRRSSLAGTRSEESQPTHTHLATSPREIRCDSRGSGERRVYGGSTGLAGREAGSISLPNADSRASLSAAIQPAISPPKTQSKGRFGSGGSGEWRCYGGRTGRLSCGGGAYEAGISTGYFKVISPPSSYTSSGPRLSGAGSGGRLSSVTVVRRSSSVGSGGRLSSSGSGGRLSKSPGSYRSSSSGEWKPVYSSASGRRSAGQLGGGGTTSSQRAPSPGGRKGASMGSGRWLSGSTGGGSTVTPSSGGSSDRISSQTGARNSSSSGSEKPSSAGGRVIGSSDWPIRRTGSGAGGRKERISVCKMAALSISAAGRERSQERQREALWFQQQQRQAAAASPLVQQWLTTGVGVTSADPGGLDDIMRL